MECQWWGWTFLCRCGCEEEEERRGEKRHTEREQGRSSMVVRREADEITRMKRNFF